MNASVVKLEEIFVPDLGDFKDVPVIEVLVSEGQEIKIDEPLITLESDKATMDVPSPVAGKINDLLIAVGDKVSQGDLILVMEVEATAKKESETPPQPDNSLGARQHQLELPTAESEIRTQSTAEVPPATEAPATQASSPLSAEQTDANIEVRVPDIGDFQDVEIIEVMVATGDDVHAEDPLISLESDKATMDVPSPIAGTVMEMKVQKGDKVSEGNPILVLQSAATYSAPIESVTHETTGDSAPAETTQISVERLEDAIMTDGPLPPLTLPLSVESADRKKSHASPSVRRFGRELGVDLQQILGTGRKGRILQEDVQSYVKRELSRPKSGISTATADTPVFLDVPEIDFAKFGEITIQPLSRIKKLTAVHVHRSWVQVPHVTQHDEADITNLEEFRKQAKEESAQRGVRLTMLAFLMKASVSALREFPTFNASLERGGDNLIIKKYYHFGIAVDTSDGLVVPIIKDVDEKGVLDLAEELASISERARNKKLTPNDLQGGTFTISSLGGIGGTGFSPIVNSPEVAILGVSRAKIKPVFEDNQFIPRLMLPLSLSYDHRVIDGAEAARFTAFLTRVLEDARRLLL